MVTAMKGLRGTRILAAMMSVAVIALSLSITGCTAEIPQEEIDQRITELEARGFGNPTFAEQAPNDAFPDTYDVSVGDCRITLHAPHRYSDYWAYGDLVDVSSSTIEAHAEALGLTHCFKD